MIQAKVMRGYMGLACHEASYAQSDAHNVACMTAAWWQQLCMSEACTVPCAGALHVGAMITTFFGRVPTLWGR